MADWVTISSLATAGGTLVLAVATFSSTRSSNRSARVAERSLLAAQRPVLIPSHEQDLPERVMFGEGHRVTVEGHGGVICSPARSAPRRSSEFLKPDSVPEPHKLTTG
jgi:hypothetical protein